MSESAPGSVGFIGLGQIGAGLAANLHAWPGGLVVCDVVEAATAPFAEKGAAVAATPADVARAERAARVACLFMLLPQLIVIALLMSWQLNLSACAVAVVVVAQLLCMKRLLSDPKRLAPWYNATGVSLYVLGMMGAALGLGGWLT